MSVSCALAAAGVRARPRKAHAEGLDEAGGRQAPPTAPASAPTAGHEEFQAPGRQLRAEQDGLEGEPFRHEAVERRQRRDRHAADQEHEGRLRHAVDQAAEMLHVAFAGGVEHGAGAEEQQALEDGMVEHMQQAGGERQRRGQRHAVRLEGQREAERRYR